MNEKMMINLIETTLEEKLKKDDKFIVYTFYEVRVKYKLFENQIDYFLGLLRNKLENMEYRVYFTGARYTYQNITKKVEDNEYIVAIKE